MPEEDDKVCKIEPKEHLAAYLEEREIVRPTTMIGCDTSLLESITSNYIIVKNILGHLHWQDQQICKCVCKMWCDAVRSLQREIVGPQDFVFKVQEDIDTATLKISGNCPNVPLAVLTFTNFEGFCKMANCNVITPSPCQPACSEVHWLLDCVDHELCYPKECNLIIRASYLIYMPLATSVTYTHMVNSDMVAAGLPSLCGIYIPSIPEVKYNVLNIKANSDLKTEFYDVVDKMSETQIFKGFLIFLTDKYLLNSLEDIVFLNHFRKVQPNDPYALGGCIIEDAVFGRSDQYFFLNTVNNDVNRAAFISENVISIAMFSVTKDGSQTPGTSGNFQMFSVVIESSEWSKARIQKVIKEFSESIPRFEHSFAFKLSCVGRDERHEYEQNTFRTFFPNLPIIGCYGNGELGHNYPDRPEPKGSINTVKRQKKDAANFGIMYSYSTVFVVLGWGKSSPPARP